MDANFDVDAAIAAHEAPNAARGKPGPKPGVKRGAARAKVARAPERPAPRAVEREPEREPERLTRKRKGNEFDQFYIDPADVPPGMDWNWKRMEVIGKDMEDFHQQGLADNGWRPVDAAKHGRYAVKGRSGAITRPGYILMERPKHLTEEAEAEVRQTAHDYERQKKEELFLADNVVRKGSGVAKSFGPIDVPE